MPIFEYLCQDCGSEMEILVRSSSQKTACTSCGSKQLEKLLSTFSARADTTPNAPCETPSACSLPQCRQGSCMMG